MVLILIILYAVQHFLDRVDAIPLSGSLNLARATIPGPSELCVCQNNRTVWDIAWSCLVTIFACSWVSVHPNIAPKAENWKKKALRRLELMSWSILSPEIIMNWAMREWMTARTLKKKYHERGWTKRHGYFLQMGGFVLYQGKNPVGALTPSEFGRLLNKKSIEIPSVKEEDIKDRSKADGLSKAFVIFQTAWFIVQCIARAIQRLPITQLELATVAFAVLNGVMYFLWWNKPLDVQSTVPVYLIPGGVKDAEVVSDMKDAEVVGDVRNVEVVEDVRDIKVVGNVKDPAPVGGERDAGAVLDVDDTEPVLDAGDAEDVVQQPRYAHPRITVPGIGPVADRVMEICGYQIRPTDYAFFLDTMAEWEPGALLFTQACVGCAFGAIHCAGWNFLFHSVVEAKLWQISSLLITGTPVVMGFGWAILISLAFDNVLTAHGRFTKINSYIVIIFAIVFIFLYILARLVLLVEALISLRNLSPAELAVVQWTTFLPHV